MEKADQEGELRLILASCDAKEAAIKETLREQLETRRAMVRHLDETLALMKAQLKKAGVKKPDEHQDVITLKQKVQPRLDELDELLGQLALLGGDTRTIRTRTADALARIIRHSTTKLCWKLALFSLYCF